MGILKTMNDRERLKQELWDKLPDYEALGMTEEDIDLDFMDEE